MYHGPSFQVHLEVKNLSRLNWCVSIAVLGVKLLKNNQSLRNFHLCGCWAAALSLMWHSFFFVLCGKKL